MQFQNNIDYFHKAHLIYEIPAHADCLVSSGLESSAWVCRRGLNSPENAFVSAGRELVILSYSYSIVYLIAL